MSGTPKAFGIAIAAGALLWFACAGLAGRREAWDSGLYWVLFYPLALAVSAYLGYRYPERPWRWPLALFLGQCLALGIRNGELGNLFPLGIVVFGVLALPGIAAAKFGARKRGSGGP